MNGDDRFFLAMAGAIVGTAFAGFARTYYLKPFGDSAPLSLLVHIHGVVFTIWILLFVAQITFVAIRRTDWHRRLGVAMALIASAMVILGAMTAVASSKRGVVPAGTGADQLGGLAFTIGNIVAFACLVTIGILLRRRFETHKRLMLLAAINLLPPAIGRIWPNGAPLLFCLFVLAGPLYDRVSRGRVHAAYTWGGCFVLAFFFLPGFVGSTAPWRSVAAWLIR